MAKEKKCDNPACSCLADEGSKYCSAYCEGTAGDTEVICECGHQICKGDALEV